MTTVERWQVTIVLPSSLGLVVFTATPGNRIRLPK